MKTIQEQIQIMTHFLNGGEIETTALDSIYWVEVKFPQWDWSNQDYRIKEQKKTITIEKWLMKAGDKQSFFIVQGDKSYLENYHSQVEKVKLLETYEVEL